MAQLTHTTGPMKYIIGDDFGSAGKPAGRTNLPLGGSPGQGLSLLLTLAETRPMSARPANCGRIAAITLPIAAMPTAPACAASATATSISAPISVSESVWGI